MKRLAIIAATAALMLGVAQCKKPDVSATVPETNTVNMTVTASPGRTAIDSADGTVVWSDGDKMYVSAEDNGSWTCKGSLTLQSGAGTPTGTFTGTLTGVSDGEHEFKFFYLGSNNGVSPSAGTTTVEISFDNQNVTGGSKGTLTGSDKYHVGYGVATGTVSGSNVSDINVTLTSKVAIAYLDFIDGETPYTGTLTLSGENIYNSMTVNFDGHFTGQKTGEECINLTNTTSSKKYVMLVPKGAGEETLVFGGGAEGTTTFYNGIVENKIYRMSDGSPIEVSVMVTPSNETNGIASEFEQGEFFSEACLPGEFTVNASGDKVHFSRGNMYWDGKFRIEENQWMTTPSAAGMDIVDFDFDKLVEVMSHTLLPYDESHVSHFYWSRDWSEAVKEVFDETQYMSKNDIFFTNETATTPNPDFEANGDKGVWRSLSGAEINYILNVDNSDDPSVGRQAPVRFAIARLHDTHGVLLFPDEYSGEYEVEGVSEINSAYGVETFPENSIEEAVWMEMESAGAVFLPLAGFRGVDNLLGIPLDKLSVAARGLGGVYWLSDCDKDTGRSMNFMCIYTLIASELLTLYRDCGASVRLVCAVEP